MNIIEFLLERLNDAKKYAPKTHIDRLIALRNDLLLEVDSELNEDHPFVTTLKNDINSFLQNENNMPIYNEILNEILIKLDNLKHAISKEEEKIKDEPIPGLEDSRSNAVPKDEIIPGLEDSFKDEPIPGLEGPINYSR
ncbi:MAG: hypothetical protein GX951_02360 [Mollicutes bacterium]|nr:hypothetical protein [Mollicutes bacterium]